VSINARGSKDYQLFNITDFAQFSKQKYRGECKPLSGLSIKWNVKSSSDVIAMIGNQLLILKKGIDKNDSLISL
jgi:hypothetical protein